MMLILLCVSLSWSAPSQSIVQLRNMIESSQEQQERSMRIQPRKVNPHRQHALAEILLARPSFLAMINRYVSGENIAHALATQKKDMYVARSKSSRWYFLKDTEVITYTMLALKKTEIYPEKDPFSSSRNKTLFDSIQVLREGCSQFTSEVDGTLRRWSGQNCSYGNVWIEWEATREYPMYILVQKK